MVFGWVLPLSLAGLLSPVLGDLPVHCLNNDISGKWKFDLTASTYDDKETCGYKHPDNSAEHFDHNHNLIQNKMQVETSLSVNFMEPNLVGEGPQDTVNGEWTMVYDEGFEFTHGKHVFFAFSKYTPLAGTGLYDTEPDDYKSDCGATLVGWYHVKGMASTKWGCFVGERTDHTFAATTHTLLQRMKKGIKNSHSTFTRNIVSRIPATKEDLSAVMFEESSFNELVDKINSNSGMNWKAKVHKQFIGMTRDEMNSRLGAKQFNKQQFKTKAKTTVNTAVKTEAKAKITSQFTHTQFSDVPDNMDWTAYHHKDGSIVNYDTPIENQGSCGSCYAMAAISAFEARIRIVSDMKVSPELSAQEILSCSRYNQGREGGYPFLAGKHAMDFGFLEKGCMAYQAEDVHCEKSCNTPGRSFLEDVVVPSDSPTRYYAQSYNYVGGYYGGCSEYEMMKELSANGPIVVAMNAPQSLFAYSEGIFQHDSADRKVTHENSVKPWEQVNHALVAVGYGMDDSTGTKYWKIKNSWGKTWGENGYFKIVRGVDECGIESMAVAIHPHVPEHLS